VSLTVLMNAGPWLPVPPRGYGGIETVLAALIEPLRRRGVRVLLATAGEPGIEVDDWEASFPDGQFPRLGGQYNEVVGIAHAHLQAVYALLRRHPETDLVHDHLEVVGPSVLGTLRDCPPVLQTLHWDLAKHPQFYATFDGHGRVFFNGVSETQLADAPPNLLAQTLGAVPLPVAVGDYEVSTAKDDYFLTLARCTYTKGLDTAARLCKELGRRLIMAGPVGGVPSPEALDQRLTDPNSGIAEYADVKYYLDAVRTYEDGENITWIGSVDGSAKLDLLRRASALLMPIRWNEPGGTAAIEALACGTPVVALRRGALTDLVQHGVNGFLADDEREFAEYLLRVGELDPMDCRRSVEERFSSDAVAERYLGLYSEVVSRARP
jgi:glycosyltransferase involved in cell wall biosynthesis